MKPLHPTRRQILAAISALAATGASAQPQAFPNRPIRIVVPFPAGGPTDAVARIVAADWQARLGWTTVVENKSGATGQIGHEEVRRSAPDGHTLMLLVNPAVVNYRFLNKPFSLPAEFTPVGMVYTQYIVMVVNPAATDMADIRTLQQLIALAKSRPGQLSYTSAGVGSMGHLTTALIGNQSGTSMTHVPYRGDAPAMNDVLGGQVPIMFVSSTTALPHIKSGRLRPLAVSSATRVAELANVPTLGESGFAGLVATAWNGMVAPPGLPAELVARLSTALKATLATPALNEKFQALGLTVNYRAADDFATWVNKEFITWSKVIDDNQITLNN